MFGGLYGRLVLLVSFIVVLTIAAYGVINYIKQSRHSIDVIKQNAELMARNLALSCVDYLVVNDFGGMEMFLERFAEFPDISRIQVYDSKGDVLSDILHKPGFSPTLHFDSPPLKSPPLTQTSIRIEDEQMVILQPVIAGAVLGWVKITYSLNMIKDTQGIILKNSVLVGIAGVIISFIAILIALRQPVNAIKRIAAFARRLDEAKGDVISIKGVPVEIEDLSSALNYASQKLYSTEKAIVSEKERFKMLHQIAVEMNRTTDIDGLLNTILDCSVRMLRSEFAAIALYDESGKYKKLIARGITIKTVDVLPEGLGILEFIRLSLVPVRIDNVFEHPAFSGSLPEGHPIVKNLLASPIFSDEGKSMGAIYFGNKEEGFTLYDETIVNAISADAAIALSRAERLSQLKKFKQVIDSAFDIIIIADANGHITYANPALETVTGYSREEAIGNKPSILKSGYHDRKLYENLWNTIKAGDVWRGEFINRKKNGEIYYASTVIFPIHTESEVYYAGIQRDITQEKKLYEQLVRSQKMEAIGTLAGGIAHDFNNLLTAVLGYSEIMMGMATEDNPFYKPASIINNAAQKGAELAKKILMVARKEKLEAKAVNINEIIHNSMELLQRSLPKNIEITLNLKENIPNIKADPSQMHQVIMNLAVNARDAMPDGGKLIIETSVVGMENGAANGITEDKGGFVKLSVSDSGTGMDTETQSRIFDPFFTTKETEKGTGLGLYIVHSVINNHNGYINIYSELDKGTRFNIYLPIAKGIDKEESIEDEDITGTGTILVIDDEPDIRELCKDILEPLGYEIMLAGNGSDGINIFRTMKDKISLVILDMIMPKMSGGEVFQTLRTMKSDIKALLCSGYSHDGFSGIDKLIKSGACGFVQKPFTRQSIAKAIKKALSE
ncbi:MAG: PAS domain S-box protein [Nitrospirae bacterium]|nr:PAS domain S-box protein [Nitrospirota bacterium]